MIDRENLQLTESIVFELAEIVQEGNFRHVAAASIGIQPSTLYSWLRRGKNELKDFLEGKRKNQTLKARLVVELERAEAECHGKLVKDVVTSDDPKLKLQFLRLRYNKLYNNNPNASVDDESGEESVLSGAEVLAAKLAHFIPKEGA